MSDYIKTINDFHAYLSKILKLYQDVIDVLKDELSYINNNDIEKLNETLKMQQALLFKTNDFDIKLAEYLSQLGISANNITEMIPKLPEENQLEFYALLGQYEKTVANVNFYREKCNTMLQTKLYTIEKSLSKLNVQSDNTTYDQAATEVRGSLHLKSFETKI